MTEIDSAARVHELGKVLGPRKGLAWSNNKARTSQVEES